MTEFTEYVAYLLYQTDKGKTYFLGNPQGVVNKPVDHVIASFNKGFGDILLNKLHTMLPLYTISPGIRPKTAEFVYRTDSKGLLIFVWVGNVKPVIRLSKFKKIYPKLEAESFETKVVDSSTKAQTSEKESENKDSSENKNLLTEVKKQDIPPAVRYELNFDILLLLNKPNILIKTINHFLRHSTEEEVKLAFSGNRLPRCTIYQKTARENPYCYLLFEDIVSSNFNETYLSVFAQCPPNYITCEVGAIFSAHFYYVRKRGLKKGGNISNFDVIKVD
jgi:hypothetical protein